MTIVGADGEASHVFHTGDPLTVRIGFRAHEPTRDFVFGLGIFNADGVCCYGTNTNLEELEPERLSGEGEVRFVVDRLDLVEGTYKFDVAVHKLDGFPYDYHRQLYTIRVKARQKDVGIYRPPHRWEFCRGREVQGTRDRGPGTGAELDPCRGPDARGCITLGGGAARRRPARRLHERRLRSAASRAYALPGRGARRSGDVADRGGQLRPVGPCACQGGRPADHAERERAEVLAALAAVDAVVVFDEETPLAIVTAIQPDVLVKGADWAADAIVGRDVVEARGGRVVRVALAPGYSTTAHAVARPGRQRMR